MERVLFPSLRRTESFFFSFFGKSLSEVDVGRLEYIDGSLFINDNSFVTSLDGLFDSLQFVNGSVEIYRNGTVYGGSTTHTPTFHLMEKIKRQRERDRERVRREGRY